jgi:hypothetical protein
MTTLKGFGVVSGFFSVLISSVLLSSLLVFDFLTGAVGGAVLAARASRCLVTLFRPIRT